MPDPKPHSLSPRARSLTATASLNAARTATDAAMRASRCLSLAASRFTAMALQASSTSRSSGGVEARHVDPYSLLGGTRAHRTHTLAV